MPFTVSDDEVRFTGDCPVDEAEALHHHLCGLGHPVFDLAQAGRLHTAIVQLILASQGSVKAAPQSKVLCACFHALTSV